MHRLPNIIHASYNFMLYPVDTYFNRVAGIYIFLSLPSTTNHIQDFELNAEMPEITKQVFYSLLYIGITNNLQYRLNNHHKRQAAIELGMTHIGIMKKSSGRKRKMIERNLLKCLNPPLNQTWLYE